MRSTEVAITAGGRQFRWRLDGAGAPPAGGTNGQVTRSRRKHLTPLWVGRFLFDAVLDVEVGNSELLHFSQKSDIFSSAYNL